MTTVGPDRPDKDLTIRARIRDVALSLFAEHGLAGTSIRMVADAGGVSVGAVQHHFGTKAGLRQACDDHAIGTLLGQAKDAMSDPAAVASPPGPGSAMYVTNERSMRYLARALVDGSPAAAALFDAGAELAEAWLIAQRPDLFAGQQGRTRDAAAAMSAMHLGTVVLHEHVSRRMGVDVLNREHAHRIGAGIADVYAAMADFVGLAAGSGGSDA
jgi:AcrR family transcriptional regulator